MKGLNSGSRLYEFWLILLGSLLVATGYGYFAVPHHVVPGGIFGGSIIIDFLTPFTVGTAAFILNVPLFLLAFWVLGKSFGRKSFLSIFLISLFIDLFRYFAAFVPHMIGGETVLFDFGTPIPSQALPFTDNILLASIIAGVLIGAGQGLIFRARSTTGGTDILAMIFTRWTGMQTGKMMIAVDSLIVLTGSVVFGDASLVLYALVTIFIMNKVADAVLVGQNYQKAVFIISEKHEDIKKGLLEGIRRGGTYFLGEGMYHGKRKKIIYTAVNRRELAVLFDYVKKIDPQAFITIFNATEIKGEGFAPIDEKETEIG